MLERKLKRAVAIEEEREVRREAEQERERKLPIPFSRNTSPLQVLIDRVREAWPKSGACFSGCSNTEGETLC